MIDDRFRGIVVSISIAAAIAGFLFGAFPGSDIPILLVLWGAGISIIILRSDEQGIAEHWFRILLVFGFVYVILSADIATVQALTLPVFFIVNPILNGVATYRILRATSKLFARRDLEENTSSAFTVLWSMAKDIAMLFGEFFGLND